MDGYCPNCLGHLPYCRCPTRTWQAWQAWQEALALRDRRRRRAEREARWSLSRQRRVLRGPDLEIQDAADRRWPTRPDGEIVWTGLAKPPRPRRSPG